MIKKNKNNLIWLDLEMTGLETHNDVILEIATVVTDENLNLIAQGLSIVIHQPDAIFNAMKDWPLKQHSKSGLLEEVRASTISLEEAETKTLQFLKQYCIPEMSPLCGNSIWCDRAFLQKYMPRLLNFTHYRMIDVTSFKEVVMRWYPNDPHIEFPKKDLHRALADVYESIEELKHFRTYFFRKA